MGGGSYTTTLCSRDEDHLALTMELLGRIPRKLITGKYAKDYFNRKGDLRHIKNLKFWTLEQVLRDKYAFTRDEVSPSCSPYCNRQ